MISYLKCNGEIKMLLKITLGAQVFKVHFIISYFLSLGFKIPGNVVGELLSNVTRFTIFASLQYLPVQHLPVPLETTNHLEAFGIEEEELYLSPLKTSLAFLVMYLWMIMFRWMLTSQQG